MKTQQQARSPFLRARNITIATITLGGLLVGGAMSATAHPGGHHQDQSPATAPDAPWTKTVTYLVSQLTPTEKVNLIHGGAVGAGDPDFHGQAGYFPPVARLGIPEIRHADALGINVNAETTSSPSRIGIASSFSRELLAAYGEFVGQEGLDADIDLLYGPQADLARTPSWSRNNTAYSEDAYLASQLMSEEIDGLQSTGLMSQVKHVGMYNGQNQSTVTKVEGQAAHEIYLAPAEKASDIGVSSMMCSYATFQILGDSRYTQPDFACQNSVMMESIIKGDWDFNGFITTDYNAAKNTATLLAGVDQEFATNFLSVANLLPLIDPTSPTYQAAYASAADESVARSLYQLERFGKLDNDHIPAPYRSRVPQTGDVDTNDNAVTIDKATGIATSEVLAERAAVLLKNSNGVLPLNTSATVNVVGQTSTLLPANPGGEKAVGFGDRQQITPVKGLTAIGGSKVTSNPGIDLLGTTVPAANLKSDSGTPGSYVNGLTRTTTPGDGSAATTTVDATLGGDQTDLVRGNTYTWTGYVDVPANDTYQLQLQRPYGKDSGNDAAYNQGVTRAPDAPGTSSPFGPQPSNVTLAVDGVAKTVANPDGNILPNALPTYAAGTPNKIVADNGQYLGYENTGAAVELTAGLHAITITYKPTATLPADPTLRLAWSAKNAAKAEAVAAAAVNDVSVIFADDSGSTGGDGASTSTSVLTLSAAQNTLITEVADAAHAAGHKAVVVLNTGSAVQTPWIDKVDGILEMWYPGQEGGTATAELLYGQANPSGHLTVSFPKDSKQDLFGTVDTNGNGISDAGDQNWERSNATTDAGDAYASFKWTEGLAVGYRWFTDPTENTAGYSPQFAFGHGLSYTDFAYSGLAVRSAKDGGLDVSFTVKNTGTRDGYDAPQVYVGPSPDLDPAKFQQTALKLVQFDDVKLEAGKSTKVALHVDPKDLSSYSTENNNWVLGTGNRTVYLGAASDDIRQSVNAKVRGNAVAPSISKNLPATTDAVIGDRVTLRAHAKGSPEPTARWQVSTDGGANWSDITGARSESYTFKPAATDAGKQYRAAFSNDLGTAYTAATTLNVKTRSHVTIALSSTKVSASVAAVVTVTIQPTSGNPTGTVKVRYGSKSVSAPITADNQGKVSVTLPLLKKGSYRISAEYSGDAGFTADESSKVTLTVK